MQFVDPVEITKDQELVAHIDRYRHGRNQVLIFVAHIKPVDPVEQGEVIPGVEEQRVPGLIPVGLGDDDSRAVLLPVAPFKNLALVPLDIHFEEVDGDAGRNVLVADLGERLDLDDPLDDVSLAGAEVAGQERLVDRPASAGSLEDRHRPVAIRKADVQVDVAVAGAPKHLERCRVRLDVDPAPASVVKVLGDRMFDGVIGTDVDIETSGVEVKGPLDHHIFKVIGVRRHPNIHRDDPHLSGSFGVGAVTIQSDSDVVRKILANGDSLIDLVRMGKAKSTDDDTDRPALPGSADDRLERHGPFGSGSDGVGQVPAQFE